MSKQQWKELFCFLDIIYEITKYLNIKDFIHLVTINKYLYENIFNENNSLLKNKFKKYEFKIFLNYNLPNYLFQTIKSLNLTKFKKNNYSLLNNFKKLNTLKILVKDLPPKFTFTTTHLNNLKKLYLFDDCMNPTEFSLNFFTNLQNLKVLHADGTYLESDCLNGLINLAELKIYDSNFNGKCLQNFKNLQKLDIRFSPITDDCFQNLNNLINLTFYFCDYINGTCFNYLQNLRVLNCQMNDNYKPYLEKLINLKELNIFGENEMDSSVLKNLINLEKLIIEGNNFKSEDFYKLSNLKKIVIYGTSLPENCLQYLIKLEKLEYFLQDIKEINYLSKVKKLSLKKVPNNIIDKDFIQLTNLVKLNICKISTINGDCLLNLINLKELDASNTIIKDEHLMNLTKLKKLIINYCPNIDGTCLFYLKNLKVLHIVGNNNVKDEYLEYLINLEILHLIKSFNTYFPELITGKFLLKLNKLEGLFVEDYFEADRIQIVRNRVEMGESFKDIVISILKD